jgi:hypothetical protein
MEQIGTTTGNGKSRQRSTEGRKDKTGQPAVMQPGVLKEKLNQLVKLKKAADEAATEFNEGVSKTAEKSGMLASVVRKVVTAAAGENFEEEKRKAEQMSLAFEEVGPQ